MTIGLRLGSHHHVRQPVAGLRHVTNRPEEPSAEAQTKRYVASVVNCEGNYFSLRVRKDGDHSWKGVFDRRRVDDMGFVLCKIADLEDILSLDSF